MFQKSLVKIVIFCLVSSLILTWTSCGKDDTANQTTISQNISTISKPTDASTTAPSESVITPQITDESNETVETTTSSTIIADFESTSPLAAWSFGGGKGAGATLTIAEGHHGNGSKLTYDFTGEANNEKYVWATSTMSTPISSSLITFWVKVEPGIVVKLNVQDSTGQTLQYPLTRPFSQTDPDSWYQYSVNLGSAPDHWGGSNDGKLHSPVVSVSIVAAALRNYNAAGAFFFDDIEASDDTSFCLDLSSISVSPVPSEMGMLSNRLGVNIHFPAWPSYELDERALDLAQAAGFTWLRMDFPWADVYKGNGVYDFSNQDKLVEAAETRDMKLIFIMDYGHELFTGAWNIQPTTPEAIKAFGNYVYEAAKHYVGHPVVWEVWNEPNIPNFWPPAPDVAQYTALLKETIQRLHEGNPDAQIITGGLAGYDFTFLEGCLDTGTFNTASAIGIHPYNLLQPEEVSDYTLLMRSIIQEKIVANPPVWDTEWGYSSAFYGDGDSAFARTKQAKMVCRELISAWAVGFPLIIYYDIRDDGTNPTDYEHNFGLLTNDYKNKTAMQAVQTLTEFAKNRVMTGIVNTKPTSLHMLMLEGQEDVVFITWLDIKGSEVDMVIPQKASVVDLLGNPLPVVTKNQDKVIKISESDGPVYVTVPR